MSQALVVSPSLTVPPEAIAFRAVRSSGPGGQNVNKVASKVELRVDLDRVADLPPAARSRLLHLAASRLDAQGHLVVVSQKTRDQSRNLEDARDKLSTLLLRSLTAPRTRRATRPSKAAKERRLEAKRRSARRKRARGRPAEE